MQQQEAKSVQRAIKTWHTAPNEYSPPPSLAIWFPPFAMEFFSINVKECSEVPSLLIIEVEKYINFK